MNQIEEVLTKQIAVAETLLQRAIAIPDGDKNTRVAGYIRYDEKITRPLAKDVDAWQTETTEYLRVLYGEDARQVADFERCINDKSHYFKFREGIQNELQDCISKLNAFIKAETMKQQQAVLTKMKPSTDKRSPLVFISHSSKDKAIIKSFVENVLLIGLGLNVKDIAFTSEEAFGVEPGENIAKYIKDNISSASIVLIMLSVNYRSSEVCLNEMGATWALGKKCVSVLLPGTGFDKLGWLTSMEKAVQIKDKTQLPSLCQTIANKCGVDIKERFTIATQKIDEFIASVSTTSQPTLAHIKMIKVPEVAQVSKEQPLKLFDAHFTGICHIEGDYIIQLNVRMRAEGENVTLKQVLLCNKSDFNGSNYKPLRQMEFKSFVKQGLFELSSDEDKAWKYLKEEYGKSSIPVLDTTIDMGHSLSISFVQYFQTIRQMDCYDELPLKGWSLLVKYNVDSEVTIPFELLPVDKDTRGKYV